jgi:hypothetical protein
MSSLKQTMVLCGTRDEVSGRLREAALDMPLILDEWDERIMRMREAMGLETYVPAELEIALNEKGGVTEVGIEVRTNGSGPYHDSHLRHLLERLVEGAGIDQADGRDRPKPGTDMSWLSDELERLHGLFRRGVLTEEELARAKKSLLMESL